MPDLDQELQQLATMLPPKLGEPLAPQTNAAMSSLAQPISLPALDDLQAQISGGAAANAPPTGISITPNLTFEQRNQRRDEMGQPIPIDRTEGLPSMMSYARISAQATPEEKLAVLNKLYPDKAARILDTGDLAVAIPDSKTGRVRDVVINPMGLDTHDLVDLAVHAPEIAAGMAAAIVTRGRGTWKTVGQIVLSGLASGGAGAVKEGVVRGAEGFDIQPGDILRRQGVNAATDMVFQGALGAGAKALGILSPFARTKGPIQLDQDAAKKFMKDQMGVDFEATQTPGQITGNRTLLKLEAGELKQPGSSRILENKREMQVAAIETIQKKALGAVPAAEDVGEGAIASLQRSKVGPLEGAVTEAKEKLIEKGETELVKQLDELTGVPSKVSTFEAGKEIRPAVAEKFAAEDEIVKKAYAKVNALPGGSGDILPGDAVAKAALEIREELPKVIKGGKTETLPSGVPEGLERALRDMEALAGGKVSLQTLTNMKRAAFDEIAKTEAVPGVKERWFTKVATAYEQGIQQGIEAVDDKTLKAALQTARDEYKQRILPFERQGLADIPRTPFEAGFKSEEELVTRLTSGSKAQHNWRVLKETLGETSTPFKKIKRAILDSEVDKATDKLTGHVDAQALEKAFTGLMDDHPQLARDVFGSDAKKLLLNLRSMGLMKRGDPLDPDEIKYLLTSENVNEANLIKLVQAERNRAETYVNGIIRDVADGFPIASKLKPTQFVDRVMDLKTPSKDVEGVLDAIQKENPLIRQDVSTVALYRVFDAADRQVSAGLKLSPSKLQEVIGAPGTDARRRFELLLGDFTVPGGGPKRTDLVDELIKLTKPLEQTEAEFRGAGGIAGQMTLQKLFTEPFQYAKRFGQKFILAAGYTSSLGRSIISNRALSPENTAIAANTLIASEPFLRQAVEILGPEAAQEMVEDAKASIDRYVREEADGAAARSQAELQRFLQGEDANVQTTVQP
jgi:hypothetical protein